MGSERAALVELCALWQGQRLVLVGASAIELQGVPLSRRAFDFDVVVQATPEVVLEVMSDALGWRQGVKGPPNWLGPGGTAVDLIPASPGLVQSGVVTWPGQDREMSLVGFRLLDEASVLCPSAIHDRLWIATTAVLTFLKVMAWLERPQRERDLQDLTVLLDHHVNHEDDRYYVGQAAERGLFGEDCSAWWLGHDLGQILAPGEVRFLDAFLGRVARPDDVLASHLARLAPVGWGRSEGEARRRFGLLQAGLRVGVQSQGGNP